MLPIPLETRRAIGLPDQAESAVGAKGCESRALLFERYANPQFKEDDRNAFLRAVTKLKACSEKARAWNAFLSDGLRLQPDQIIFAQLQSRLMLNMAGGVMENAGLCLDRFGVPYIPGSAVKGCARRMATEQLRQAANDKKPIKELADLLADIVLVFGWGETDWRTGRKRGKNGRKDELHSDFEFACGESGLWLAVRDSAVLLFQEKLMTRRRAHTSETWKDMADFAGSLSFLPAYPWRLAERDLELDVLTCHHPDYYGRKKNMPVALDSEQRIVPVVFPSVAPGIVFQFVMLPLREYNSLSCPGKKLHQVARDWLSEGLAVFGLGAKTAAGYGWFKEVKQPEETSDIAPTARGTAAAPSSRGKQASLSASAEHPIIAQWRGKTQPGNFRAFRPLLAGIKDVEELRRVFNAIMPANEVGRLKKSSPYWQSFASDPQGKSILERLDLTLT